MRLTMRHVAVAATIILGAGLTAAIVDTAPAAAMSLTVTTAVDVVADDGGCSLREAIEAADTDTASGSSTGECAAGSGADVITFAVPGPFLLTGGELQIDSEVTVDGGAGVTVDAMEASRVFRVSDLGVATFEALTITGGRVDLNTEDGGGILNDGGVVTVSDSTIDDHQASSGGGVANRAGGELTVNDTTVSNGFTLNGGGGISNDGAGTTMLVSGSTFVGNASFAGGPVDDIANTAGATVSGSTVGRVSSGGQGVTAISESTIGDIFVNSGTVDVDASLVARIVHGSLPGSSTTVTNSTVSGGGVGIRPQGGSVTIAFSTVTGNDTGILTSGGATVDVTASIVAGNSGDDVSGPGFTSGGFNVIGDGPGAAAFTAAGDVTGVGDPGLGPLGDNGGPTQTHALLAGSPAIDRVTAGVGSDPSLDQRGVARPQGVAKDAGAFERDEVVLQPGGFGTAEGQSGSQVFEIPIALSRPSTETITVDYMSWPCQIFDGCGDGLATEGVDYESPAPGTLTFLPGETTKTVPVTVYGDLEVEPAYLWGEWFLIRFLNPSPNAVLDTSFFGLGAGVIGSDDP